MSNTVFYAKVSSFASSQDDTQVLQAVYSVIDSFAWKDCFFKIAEDVCSSTEKKLINSFKKNVELLVQKTWVEKSDDELKENTLYRIGKICSGLLNSHKNDKYKELFFDFFSMLHDVVVLLFGSLTETDSFAEYAARIDSDFGAFWIYIDTISKIKIISEYKARIAVLLAMSFLANF